MKAIKFLILGAGIIGIVSFFLPYAEVDNGTTTMSFSALDVMIGVDIAEEAVGAAKDAVEARGAALNADLREIEETLDTIKGIFVLIFLPTLVFLVVGLIAAIRRKLERPGGVLVLIAGVVGTGINMVFLSVWGSADVEAAGGHAGMAQFILVFASIVGFVGGLLTLIKPDRGGRFG